MVQFCKQMAQSKGLRFKAWSMCRKSGWLTKKLGGAFERNFLQNLLK